MYVRKLDLRKLVKSRSCFLFGPRSVGKSSLIREELADAIYIDLLNDDVYDELARRPVALAEKVGPTKKLIVIDEVQKLPKILDEVHRLIESKDYRFLLTGSSARKLRKDGANMLGGRAGEARLFPLSWAEIPDFNLLRYLNFGGIPRIYLSKEPEIDLKNYVRTYVSEEIRREAAVRDIERFVRFLEAMALGNAQELNFAALASDSGVPVRTIENHIEVLKDTLMGFELPAFRSKTSRKAVTRSKFFIFDIGVANHLSEKLPLSEGNADLGQAFEQFIIQEVRTYLSYHGRDDKTCFWRQRDAEVDLIVGKELAIEIKFSKSLKDEHFKGLETFTKDHPRFKKMIVGRFPSKGTRSNTDYLPWKIFLEDLWSGKIL